jgi:hypothetical protein
MWKILSPTRITDQAQEEDFTQGKGKGKMKDRLGDQRGGE